MSLKKDLIAYSKHTYSLPTDLYEIFIEQSRLTGMPVSRLMAYCHYRAIQELKNPLDLEIKLPEGPLDKIRWQGAARILLDYIFKFGRAGIGLDLIVMDAGNVGLSKDEILWAARLLLEDEVVTWQRDQSASKAMKNPHYRVLVIAEDFYQDLKLQREQKLKDYKDKGPLG